MAAMSGLIGGILILAAILFYIYFNRDPNRDIPRGNSIIAPADGKIIGIIKIERSRKGKKREKQKIKKGKSGILGRVYALTQDTVKQGYLISIFMTPLDVHVQRAPIDGKVIKTQHSRGRFLNASTLAALENEKNEIIIRNKKIGKIKVIQIAGFLARRIHCWVDKNQNLLKGQRIGKIKLGSQVVLIIPKSKIKIKARVGQRTKAGETILAEY